MRPHSRDPPLSLPPKQSLHIATIVRVRPLLPSELNSSEIISCKEDRHIEVNLSGAKRIETVDLVLEPTKTQREVFAHVETLLKKVAEGFNVSILTYGQTGSGKTYTMFGRDWSHILRNSKQSQATFIRSLEQDENHAGIIPRCMQLLFGDLLPRRKHTKIYCSFVQLYNESLTDLLETEGTNKLIIHENMQDGIYVEGLSEVEVNSFEECASLMERGEANRIVRQTAMNEKSSRSHTIFQFLLEQVFPTKKEFRRMKINLCDLAGSQKLQKNERMGTAHFQELRNINLSLTTLGKVIGCLTSKMKPVYRDSKLTRLLQDCLGGNTCTAIIATITTKTSCLQESMNTLKFLERAKQVKTEVVARNVSENPQMRSLEREISYLKDVLKMKRTGAGLPDMEVNQQLKRLQLENDRLKELVDQELVDKLKRQNNQLKAQLTRKHIQPEDQRHIEQQDDRRQTIDYPNREYQKRDYEVESNTSEGKYLTVASKSVSKQPSRFKGKADENASSKDTLQDTTVMFPSLTNLKKQSSKTGTSKILDRILEIDRAKQKNKVRLEEQLMRLEQRQNRGLDR